MGTCLGFSGFGLPLFGVEDVAAEEGLLGLLDHYVGLGLLFRKALLGLIALGSATAMGSVGA